jgi:hypothetical protein
MYAGHDSTISNLLSALKVWDSQIPGYGIMALIELHHNNETGHHIKVRHYTCTINMTTTSNKNCVDHDDADGVKLHL